MKIVWLGQGGYLIEQAQRRLVVDPYLTDALAASHGLRRLVLAPLTIEQLRPDAVFITHDHLDHFDPETLRPLLQRWPDCSLLGPKSVIEHARHIGIEKWRLTEVSVGDAILLPGFSILPTPAKHSDPHAVGLLVNGDDKLAYISGDTLYDARLASQVAELAINPLDAAMLCINGRLGNMNLDEAATLAAALRPAVAVPMHYGLFAENTADPDAFAAACRTRRQPVRVLEIGEPLQL
jgi:L-ascorbate 6-phosphate lactonase